MSSSDVRAALAQLVVSSEERFRTAEDRVAAVVRGALGAGIFRPGERLRQDVLADLLGVSRQPVRAALRQLESEGLVELLPHRGAVVRSLTADELQELYEMRILIETHALRKSAVAVTPEAISALEKLAKTMDSASSSTEWFELRDDFYRSLYGLGNSPRAVAVIMQLRAEVAIHTKSVSQASSHAHWPLLDHLTQDAPDLAASWLETHLRSVSASIRSQFPSEDMAAED